MSQAANLTRETPVTRLLDRRRSVPPLEPGDYLTRTEFERRYEAMPGKTKFELINGIVYMASPVKDEHAEFQIAVIDLLDDYAIATPGCSARGDATVRLAHKDEPQPDGFLRIREEAGGSSYIDNDGYVAGPVELVAEVATSTASYDLNQKKRSYLLHGVLEYLAVLTRKRQVFLFARRGKRYVSRKSDAHGVVRSEIFPGLWIDVPALSAGDRLRLRRTAAKGLRSKEHRAFVKELRSRARRRS